MDKSNSFRKLFQAKKNDYRVLKSSCSSEIAVSKWATDDMFDYRPFAAELGFKPGKWLPSEPKKREGLQRYEFDGSGRVVMATWLQDNSYGETYREYFHVRSENQLLIAVFDTDKIDNPPTVELKCLESYQYGEHGVTCFQYLNFLGNSGGDYMRYEYEYQAGRIVGVHEYWQTYDDWWPTRWEVTYNSKGDVRRIVQVEGGDDIRPYNVIYARNFLWLHKMLGAVVMNLKLLLHRD